MKELKPSGLMAIEVPEDAYDFYLMSNKQWVLYRTKTSDMEIIKGKSKCDLVGWCTNDDISFGSSPYVESWKITMLGLVFRDYTGRQEFFTSPDPSFRSLLTANGIDLKDGFKYLILKPINP